MFSTFTLRLAFTSNTVPKTKPLPPPLRTFPDTLLAPDWPSCRRSPCSPWTLLELHVAINNLFSIFELFSCSYLWIFNLSSERPHLVFTLVLVLSFFSCLVFILACSLFLVDRPLLSDILRPTLLSDFLFVCIFFLHEFAFIFSLFFPCLFFDFSIHFYSFSFSFSFLPPFYIRSFFLFFVFFLFSSFTLFCSLSIFSFFTLSPVFPFLCLFPLVFLSNFRLCFILLFLPCYLSFSSSVFIVSPFLVPLF